MKRRTKANVPPDSLIDGQNSTSSRRLRCPSEDASPHLVIATAATVASNSEHSALERDLHRKRLVVGGHHGFAANPPWL